MTEHDIKYIKRELENIKELLSHMKGNTDKMSIHIDFVENHIRWVTNIANFFIPKLKKPSVSEDNSDEFFKRFNDLL